MVRRRVQRRRPDLHGQEWLQQSEPELQSGFGFVLPKVRISFPLFHFLPSFVDVLSNVSEKVIFNVVIIDFSRLTMTRMVILGVTVALIIILLAVAMGLGFGLTESSSAAVTSWANGTSGPQTSTKPAPVYQLRSASEPSVLGNFSNFAVAIDGEPCAQIGV